MEPITEVRELTHLAYAFKGSKALLSGLEVGIFDSLGHEPKSLSGLATATGLAKNRLETLLTALVSLGLLSKEGERYENAPAVQKFLVSSQPTYLGEYLLLQTDRFLFPAFAELTAELRGQGGSSAWGEYQTLMTDPLAAAEFSRGQHAGSLGPAAALAKTVDLTGRVRLLDVGGGSGAFTIMCCGRNPDLEATIFDFQAALDVADGYVTGAGLSQRVDYATGDALKTAWPKAHDVVLMSYLTSAVSGNAIGVLFKRAFAALPSGGLLVVHDFMVDDDLTGPTDAALWFLSCMFNSADACVLTPARIAGEMAGAGFEQVEVRPLIPDLTCVATAVKPS